MSTTDKALSHRRAYEAIVQGTASPDDLRLVREWLGFSQAELASLLGYKENGERTVRAWEHGEREGRPFKPTDSALVAIKYLAALVALRRGEPIRDVFAQMPETLR